ncbi:MAG: hypothetical protein MI700_14550, partial [Balneolales bacterium]|nr:hypothetical protein [Balneolales bacterium]
MTRKGITAILNNGIEFFMGSLVLILITKRFSTEEAGAWIVFLTIVLIGTKFREGITQNSLMKFTVGLSKKEKVNVYVLSVLITLGIELVAGSLMLLVSKMYAADALGALLANYIWLIIPQSLFRLFQFMSQSRLEVKAMLASNFVLLNFTVLSLAYISLTDQSYSSIPAILGVGYAITVLWQVLMHNVLNWEFNLRELHIPEGYLNFAGNGLLRELFGTISSKAYILLTAGFIGYTESAFVGIASRYANLIYLPNTAYQGLLYPKACEFVNNGWVQAMFKYYRRAVSWMQAAFIPYVLILLTIGSAGIVILHGQEYLASIPFFIALILAGAFIAPYGH